MTAANTTRTQRRQLLDKLRAELRECYRAEERPHGRIEDLARQIAEIQSAEHGGNDEAV